MVSDQMGLLFLKCLFLHTKRLIICCHILMKIVFASREGDCSLSYWRQVHEVFFREELAAAGSQFHLQIPVLCEVFEVLYLSETK